MTLKKNGIMLEYKLNFLRTSLILKAYSYDIYAAIGSIHRNCRLILLTLPVLKLALCSFFVWSVEKFHTFPWSATETLTKLHNLLKKT